MSKNESELNWRQKMVVEEHEKLSPRLIYEIIRKHGIEELNRPAKALIFSGVTAGLIISFSFVFKAIFKAYLPDSEWAFLIENIGYTVGFIIVIIGHMQLFTENTITTVVPLFSPFSYKTLCKLIRLWGIVFISNIIGTGLAAYFILNNHLFEPKIIQQLDQIALHITSYSVSENIIKGIPAGILIASLVWMLPSVNNKVLLIFLITYLMALGGFTHVIVGSSEAAYWMYKGNLSLSEYFFTFLFPTTIGNVIGGTGVFTLLIYGQVNEEIS